MTRALRLLMAAALLAAAPLTAAPVTAHAATTPPPQPAPGVLATRATSDGDVVVVVGSRGGTGTTGVPDRPPTATVATDGGTQAAEVRPVWSDDAAIGLVVTASGDAGPAFQAGLSGAAGLLLQLPAESRSGVVADRKPPAFVAGPAVGAADDVQALSELTPGGGRDTSAALTLALDRLPARRDERTVLVLYTVARDAGGEPASALGERLRDAGAVLAVVTTAPDAGYWTTAAQTTGGLAVVAPADRPIRAFDQVADTLRTRYVATFPRPATGGAELRWTVDGATSALPVTIPAARAAGAADAAPGRTDGGGTPALPLVAGLVVAVLLSIGAVAVFLRRPGPEEPSPDDLVPAVPEGVRVFDVETEAAPKEITGSLFEPRSVRDAREAEAQGATAESAEAEEREAREWAARRLADLQQRRREEAAAAAEREKSGG
jgi:hypothetical protein